MITIKPTEAQKDKAIRLSKQLGSLKNSITKGEGNYAGLLAEIIMVDYLQGKHQSCRNYDIVLDGGKTVDVKTKRTTVYPKEYYACTIPKTSANQKCDIYVFCRYNTKNEHVYICGYIDKSTFFDRAHFGKKGEKDPYNTLVYKADCYEVAINDLKSIEDLL